MRACLASGKLVLAGCVGNFNAFHERDYDECKEQGKIYSGTPVIGPGAQAEADNFKQCKLKYNLAKVRTNYSCGVTGGKRDTKCHKEFIG